LLYALGEIAIIIIGILVAVQVNNSNERKQERDTQIELLNAIQAELETDFNNLSADLDVHKGQVHSSQIIIDHLKNNLPYHDSLSQSFLGTSMSTILVINKGGFETLKSLGVGVIDNLNLRKEIIYMYDGYYSLLGDFSKDLSINYQHGLNNIFNSRFEEAENYDLLLGEQWEGIAGVGGMIPLNFEALKNDSEYLYYLKTRKNTHKLYITFLEEALVKITEVVLDIEKELMKKIGELPEDANVEDVYHQMIDDENVSEGMKDILKELQKKK